MKNGVAVYMAVNNGADFIIEDINNAGENIEKVERANIIGKLVTEVFPGVRDFGLLEVFQRVWHSGNPEEHPVSYYKDERIDGWRENYVFKLPSGEIVAVYDDITDQKLIQQDLNKYEKDLKASQHIARLGSWRLDVATNEVTWTEELYRMYDFDPQSSPPPFDEQMKIFTPQSWELLTVSLDRTVKTGEPYELELEMAKDGIPIGWMWVRGEAVQDETGKTVELWGAAQDITDRKNLELLLLKSEEFLNRTGEMARVGGWEVDIKTDKVFWTKASRILHEVSTDYEPTLKDALSYFPGKSGEILTNAFNRAVHFGETYDLELDFVSAKGTKLKVRTIGQAEHINGECKRVFGVFQDITLQKEYNKQKERNASQYQVLADLHSMFNASRAQLFDFIIESSKKVTESEFAFFGIMSDDETEMSIHAWSKNAMAECKMLNHPKHFPISQSGIWGDCVRQRKVVIYNDYNLDTPSKHGIPKGHVSVKRFMGVPVFEGDKIVAVGAVANKAEPYKDYDANAVCTIYDRLWDVIMRNKAENSLHEIEWLLEKTVSNTESYEIFSQDYGDVTELNTCRTIMDSMNRDMLASIARDTIDLLETSVAVYEKNGDYAFGMFSSGWCRLMDNSSRKLCDSDDNAEALTCGKWHCHENCWNESAKVAIKTGAPTDIECVGGIHLYAEPIFADGQVIGSINIGYGDPPHDNETLGLLSKKYQVDISELKQAASQYRSRPHYLVEIAKNRLKTSAQLIGKQVESRIVMSKLKERVKELDCLQKFSQIVEKYSSIDGILSELVYLLRDAMSYSSQTGVRIIFQESKYETENYFDVPNKISADIIENKRHAGRIEIINNSKTNEDCLFLDEEQNLIDLIAERTGHIIERLLIQKNWSNLLEMTNEAVIFADQNGIIHTTNQAAADLCGYSSANDLKGVHMTTIYAETESRDKVIEQLQKQGGKLKNLEFLLMRKDGSTVSTLCNVRLIKDIYGKIIGTIGAIRDISDVKRIQDDLFVKDWAVESSINALAMADLDGKLSYVNKAFLNMWGYDDKHEVLDRRASEFWSVKDDAEKVINELQKKGSWKGEMTAVKNDGSPFIVTVSASIVLNDEDNPVCMFAAFENITELVKIKTQLEASVEEKQRLFEELKHRIKNSFNIIQGMLHLNSDTIEDEHVGSLLNDIRSRVVTMGELYSLMNEENISGNLRLDIYCIRIVKNLKGAYTNVIRDLEFDTNFEPIETTIKMASIFGIIVNEILTNSIKYGFPDGKSGKVALSLKKSENSIFLDICDNGVGLPDGFTLEHDSGFGLQLLQSMIKQLKGVISISDSDGAGFNIRVPFKN